MMPQFANNLTREKAIKLREISREVEESDQKFKHDVQEKIKKDTEDTEKRTGDIHQALLRTGGIAFDAFTQMTGEGREVLARMTKEHGDFLIRKGQAGKEAAAKRTASQNEALCAAHERVLLAFKGQALIELITPSTNNENEESSGDFHVTDEANSNVEEDVEEKEPVDPQAASDLGRAGEDAY